VTIEGINYTLACAFMIYFKESNINISFKILLINYFEIKFLKVLNTIFFLGYHTMRPFFFFSIHYKLKNSFWQRHISLRKIQVVAKSNSSLFCNNFVLFSTTYVAVKRHFSCSDFIILCLV
jgi:hypothetical protein